MSGLSSRSTSFRSWSCARTGERERRSKQSATSFGTSSKMPKWWLSCKEDYRGYGSFVRRNSRTRREHRRFYKPNFSGRARLARAPLRAGALHAHLESHARLLVAHNSGRFRLSASRAPRLQPPRLQKDPCFGCNCKSPRSGRRQPAHPGPSDQPRHWRQHPR